MMTKQLEPIVRIAGALSFAGAGVGAGERVRASGRARTRVAAVALLVAVLAVPGASTARADTRPADDAKAWRLRTDPPDRGFTVETSLLWPVFPGKLFVARVALPIASGGELLIGAQGKIPEERPDEGTFNNLDAQLGWRQSFGWGLHVDGLLNVGWGRVRDSTVDGMDYDSLDGEVMILGGWHLAYGRVRVLLQPVGLGAVFYKSNPWPIRGQGKPTTEGPIYVGNVVAGVHF